MTKRETSRIQTGSRVPIGEAPALALVVYLAGLTAVGQFSTSVYLPSLPGMARALSASASTVQLTLSLFLAGIALGQLVIGPLSDRFGRRPVLVVGLAVYAAASLACMAAPGIGWVLAGRLVQAAGACTGLVVGRAIVRDLFDGASLGRVNAHIGMVFAVVPGAAPILGGVLEDAFGWRASFAAMTFAGLAFFGFAAFRQRETNRRLFDRLTPRDLGRSYLPLLRSPAFLGYALALAASSGALFVYFASAPLVFIDRLGLSATLYGLLPALVVPGVVLGSFAASRWIGRVGPDRMIVIGAGTSFSAAAAMAGLLAGGIVTVPAILAPMFVFLAGVGMVTPSATAGATMSFPERAGTAAALMGFLQMAGGAAAAFLASRIGITPISGFAFLMAAFSASGILIFTALVLVPRAIEKPVPGRSATGASRD